MYITVIVILILFVYGAFSTIFHSTDMVGNIGKLFGEANLNLFGYLAYIDLIILFYPLYRLYHDRNLLQRVEFFVGWMLFFISLIILQSLLLEFGQSGGVGTTLKLFLQPYIGKAGMWLLWLLTFLVSFVLLYDEILELRIMYEKMQEGKDFALEQIKDFISKFDNPFFDKQSTEVMSNIVLQSMSMEQKQKRSKPKKKKIIKKKRVKPSTVEKEKKKPSNELVILKELATNKLFLKQIERGKREYPKDNKLPSLDLLAKPPKRLRRINKSEVNKKLNLLSEKLIQFKIDAKIDKIYSGPLLIAFEFKLAPNVKILKVSTLQDNLAIALGINGIRLQLLTKEKNKLIIEMPNKRLGTIYLRDILESDIFRNSKSPLVIALGKDIVGNPFVIDLKQIPHLLISGTTGSGKFVGINGMVLSLLYRNDHKSLRLLMIDPKSKFLLYNGIPHLLMPIITEATEGVIALTNIVSKMEKRYELMKNRKIENIDKYNKKFQDNPLPHIVVIVNELGDLMMLERKDVESSISKLTEGGRDSGIHLIVATQRPSVDVVTRVVKDSFLSKLSYRVGQKIDSRIVLDTFGADSLLNKGDSLFSPKSGDDLIRLHAPWNSKEEIEKVVGFFRT